MKNKGFTLIELLAVIVILAIISLIATPIILGIINDARDEAKQRTAELVANSVELAYTSYLFDSNGSEPTSVCEFMNSKHFAMDKGTLTECTKTDGNYTGTSATVKASDVTFTVTYNKGEAVITPDDTTVKTETVKLATN